MEIPDYRPGPKEIQLNRLLGVLLHHLYRMETPAVMPVSRQPLRERARYIRRYAPELIGHLYQLRRLALSVLDDPMDPLAMAAGPPLVQCSGCHYQLPTGYGNQQVRCTVQLLAQEGYQPRHCQDFRPRELDFYGPWPRPHGKP